MIIDGKKLAGEVTERTAARALALGRPPKVAFIVANETLATASYMRAKERAAREAGCTFEIIRLPEEVGAVELRLAVDATLADATVVQLPLPEGVVAKEVCDAIPIAKDADVLSTAARMRFEANEPDALMPPVAGALAAILESVYGKPLDWTRGKRAVVLGDGWLVGRPCATWLSHKGANVIRLKDEGSDMGELRLADIIVSGAGSPHLIGPDMIKDGCVLIDAGTSELSGKLVGDAHPDCAAKCALFTPVPGGVGPVAVAKLFENVVALAERES